ncbi:hypothetical protein BOQ63_000975 (plasmid) [Streptomyces viridifaciens]|nr:hypothetical protein BOQ63_000975 [Streptomyces viridifaciens]
MNDVDTRATALYAKSIPTRRRGARRSARRSACAVANRLPCHEEPVSATASTASIGRFTPQGAAVSAWPAGFLPAAGGGAG